MYFPATIKMHPFMTAILIVILHSLNLHGQQSNNTGTQKPPQGDINAAMEKAMQNMTPEQKEQMKKMMGNLPAAIAANGMPAHYPEFSNNRELLYKKDIQRINAIPKKKLAQADISAYAKTLYTKIIAKGNKEEVALINSLLSKGSSADYFANAAVTSMLQGHAQTAMAMSMKAIQTDPSNTAWQNNMASLLTQYGYAELAIPVLQKLTNELPDNSTLLNNLAQAWFNLGQTDSARYFATSAINSNPLNPDALVCGGVLDEAEGNTEDAINKYTQAMAQSPDPFTEALLKNSIGKSSIDNIDYNKLKNSITIYAYFPKDWMQVPVLSDNVAGFETDAATKNGYAKMFIAFKEKLQRVMNLSKAGLTGLAKQDKNAFAEEMMKQGMKNGNSFISTPARIIISLIRMRIAGLSMSYAKRKQSLDSLIKARIKQKIDAGKNDECQAADRRNNQLIQELNPIIRGFYQKSIEEYRTWLNACCTWTWYVSGNIQNVALTECLSYTQFYANLFRSAVETQLMEAPHCSERNDGSKELDQPMPEIPSFNCPTVVAVPAGTDWYAMDNSLKNFDANSLGIKNLDGAPIPNMSIITGAGIAQTGQAGFSPFIKTSNGSLLPQYGGAKSPEYPAKISEKEFNEFVDNKLGEMLKKNQPKSTNGANDVIDKKLGQMLRDNIQKMLTGMMLSDCDELKSMKESDRKKALEEKLKKLSQKLLEEALKEEWFQEYWKGQNPMPEDLAEVMKPILNSSMQAPGTFTPQKNLFQ